jgi:predicted nucleic acid-binding protein
MAVLDASVYVALMNANKPHHARSWRWLQQAQSDHESLVAPIILLAEVAAAISRGTDDLVLARQVIQQLKQSKLIRLAVITPDLAERAAEIAVDHQIRGCDAIYVALADQMKDELVTLDKQQFERGSAVVKTREP